MTNLLSNPHLWMDDQGNIPPSYWNGTAYVFNSGPSGGPNQAITCQQTAVAGDTASALFDNLAICHGSVESDHVVQMVDVNGSPNSPYYENGTDMQSVGTWTITTNALDGGEQIQILCDSQASGFYAYDFTLTPPTTFTANNETFTAQENSAGNVLPQGFLYNGSPVTPSSVSISAGPSHGTAFVVAGKVQYTPTPGYTGTDSLQYTGTYASSTSTAGTVSITVAAASYLMRLIWSDDGGHHWSNAQEESMGAAGQTAQRVIFRRIGSTRRNTGLDRILEVSSEAYTQVALVGASIGDG
jgi:hypothetical protein